MRNGALRAKRESGSAGRVAAHIASGVGARVAAGAAAGAVALAIGLLAPSSPARADAKNEGRADALAAVRACSAERDDAKRLACFDRAAAALPADAALASGAAPAASPPPPKMTPEERFGFRGQVAREEIEKRKAEDTALDELQAKVVRVGAQGSGDFVVTLDNGQVWAQIPTGKPERVKVDDAITIKRASFGSFMLSAPHARGVRVRRVK